MTLRLRLTLLYGACFIAAGAGLLAITYALFTGGTRAVAVQIRGGQLTIVNVGSSGSRSAFAAPIGGGGIGTGGGSGGTGAGATGAGRTGAGGTGAGGTSAGGTSAGRIGGGSSAGGAGGGTRAGGGSGRLARQGAPSPATLPALLERANAALASQRAGDQSLLLEESGIALGVMALIAVALAWWVAGRALRPLRVMNERARSITEDSLGARLAVDVRGDELGELAVTFDELLARLERAFEAQRRFVANASHELRTPLTFERALVEVALADPDASVQSLRRACERVVSSTEQQERLIDALLTLARSQGEIRARDAVDLTATVDELLAARRTRLIGIEVEATLEPAALSGETALIERMVANLLDNAIVHNAGEARWIQVQTATRDGHAVLRIANSGPVIGPARVDELFEPFHRLEGERGFDGPGGGLGLGLSIVRGIAAAHGAEVHARALPEGGLELELRFPRAPLAVLA